MKFMDELHERRFHEAVARMIKDDETRVCAAYLMSLDPEVWNHAEDVFDFARCVIRPEGIFAEWQTFSTESVCRLMFNLWNGRCCDHGLVERKFFFYDPYTVSAIFSDENYGPYFCEAVRLNFERIWKTH